MSEVSGEFKSNLTRYLTASALTCVCGVLLIAALGENSFGAIDLIFRGAFGSLRNLGNTLRWATPCLLVGAAASVAFRGGVINMGIEGQMYLGALAAAVVGYSCELPPLSHAALCLFAAALAGMTYAAIPVLLKLFLNVGELVSTLMLNFIARLMTEYITLWVIMGGLQTASGSASVTTPMIARSAELSPLLKGTTVSTGLFIALTVLTIVWFVERYTVMGYKMRQAGQNPSFARQGGVKIAIVFASACLASGLIAGLCGGVEVQGANHRFTPGFSKNMGWDGIMIAIVARNNPLAVVVVSLLWGALKAGAMHMERLTSLNRLVVNIIQMMFVLFVAVDYQSLFERWLSDRALKIKKES
jgi:simple sugar transport system permease protein